MLVQYVKNCNRIQNKTLDKVSKMVYNKSIAHKRTLTTQYLRLLIIGMISILINRVASKTAKFSSIKNVE